MTNQLHFYGPLTKVEKRNDGTLRVHGIASTESIDSDGEIITAGAMKAALPDFFKHGTGALREMHQGIAAGTVDEAEVAGDVTRIVATIVDAEAVKKVLLGVYKGFSIGGRVKARDAKNRKIVTQITLAEISLVDRPSNPDAILTVFKADSVQAKHRAAKGKPAVSRESVDTLMATLSPEGRAHVITQAIQHLRVQPNLPWLRY
jgi:phage head maturation protease